MGSTFVTITRNSAGDEAGFWMRDGLLELWLRLLALHLPEPHEDGENSATIAIRNQWLLASRGYFSGCVPHGLEDACSTDAGKSVVRIAINSMLAALNESPAALDSNTLNLLGIEGTFSSSVERATLQEIGLAFLALLDGKITTTAASSGIIPASIVVRRS